MINKIISIALYGFIAVLPINSFANSVNAREVVYEEKEEGTDFYVVKYTVSDNLIRIDDSDNPEGYGNSERKAMDGLSNSVEE